MGGACRSAPGRGVGDGQTQHEPAPSLQAPGDGSNQLSLRAAAGLQCGLCEKLAELEKQKPRHGYRRLLALLGRRGWKVNHKRLDRLYREEHLSVRRLKRKRLVGPAAPDGLRRTCR